MSEGELSIEDLKVLYVSSVMNLENSELAGEVIVSLGCEA